MFLVSKNACPLRGISDGPDGPKFDVRARGFPPRAPSASPAGRGAAPSGARFAPLRVVIPPAAGLGRAVSASRVRFARPRNPRHARPAGCAWLRVAPLPASPPLTLCPPDFASRAGLQDALRLQPAPTICASTARAESGMLSGKPVLTTF